MKMHTEKKEILSDKVTPVELYLKLRDRYPGTLLLESGDYHGGRHGLSYLCFDPIAGFILNKGVLKVSFPGEKETEIKLSKMGEIPIRLHDFRERLQPVNHGEDIFNGIFGYTGYEAAALFDKVNINDLSNDTLNIPLMRYHFYHFIIVINHHQNRMTVIENLADGGVSHINDLLVQLNNFGVAGFPFKIYGEEKANMSDQEFIELVKKGKTHCKRGDVFQIVLSRRFSQGFSGDEFNVYRALRFINPSPWMFYFDYGEYRIFGSSPESQILIDNGRAAINPIAGTYRRTGNDKEDMLLAEKLLDDPKELAEHVMLVDLARNDLSRHSKNVTVSTFKEIQFYSHVLHMVSSVTGDIPGDVFPETIFADTFPAGTLSGAPKIKALELISQYEPDKRSFYGGAIGKIGFNNGMYHAITIRSFISKDNTLHYQAGAGIVNKSEENCELQEVNNKLGALRFALNMATEL
jgi:anthranilate synthase component I